MLNQILITSVFVLVSLPLFAQSSSQDERPTIGVVLAGGGAKGAAHIGVLKALEELRVPVDIITGTSMGSYVGGLYASGQSAEQIEVYLTSIDWLSGYRDQVARSDRRLRDKTYEDRYQIHTDLGVGKEGIKTPKGVVQGQGMLRILRQTSGNPLAMESFDEMPIRYRAVATDIVKLEEVIIDSGYLVDAMMASMSVPGALPPHELDGRLLVDGGVVNNMPVDLAQEMGADYIIAVDISSNYKDKESLRSFLDVGDQLSNYLVRRGTDEKSKLLTVKDTYIKPSVGKIGTTEFSAMPEAYKLGYEAAMKHKQELLRYAVSEQQYALYQQRKASKQAQMRFGNEISVETIEIENQSHYNEEILLQRIDVDPIYQPTAEEIEQGIDRLYALDRFERITYQYEQRESENVIVVDVSEKDWGPNYLDFRFFLEDDFDTESQYGLGASVNFTDLGRQGAELRTNFELGTDKLISADLYAPFFANQLLFNNLVVAYSDRGRNVSLNNALGNETDDLSETKNFIPLTYEEISADLSIGLQPKLWSEVKAGVRYINGTANVSFISSQDKTDYERIGFYVRYFHDTLDSFSLPTRGSLLELEYLVSNDKADAVGAIDAENAQVGEFKANYITAATFAEQHTLLFNAELGLLNAENNYLPIDPYSLGGFQHLSGIARNSLIGSNKAFSKLVYRYRWFENDFGMFQSPVYVGTSIEYGGVWNNPEREWGDLPLFVAGSVFTGIDSPIGSIFLGYGYTEDDMRSVYLMIGTPFR